MRRTVAPSSEMQASIDRLLSRGLVDGPQKMLSELARVGARLIILRVVEDEFDRWLGRAWYERRCEGPPRKRNGFRARHLQTAEGELQIEIPQAREAVRPFVSKLFPKWHCERLGRFPGETSCLSLVWAVLDLFFSHASNGATFTDVDRQHPYRIKYQQADPDTIDEEVTAA